MSGPKFTPGPWTVKFSTEIGGQRDGKAVHVARINKENPQLVANARLIAAAPDLYAVLDAFLSDLDESGDVGFTIRQRARALLNKVEGLTP